MLKSSENGRERLGGLRQLKEEGISGGGTPKAWASTEQGAWVTWAGGEGERPGRNGRGSQALGRQARGRENADRWGGRVGRRGLRKGRISGLPLPLKRVCHVCRQPRQSNKDGMYPPVLKKLFWKGIIHETTVSRCSQGRAGMPGEKSMALWEDQWDR